MNGSKSIQWNHLDTLKSDALQALRLPDGWVAEIDERSDRILYYSSKGEVALIPPETNWCSISHLPYGWERAKDRYGRVYFIDHVSRQTTYDDPFGESDDDEYTPPQPRTVEIIRNTAIGFGFVAGSEKPVIVRYVTEGGPSVGRLWPGDQILRVNSEDVENSPRERVIELVRNCKSSVTLVVCQPHIDNSIRKSAMLSAAKKARLRYHPGRVRFADGVTINGTVPSHDVIDDCPDQQVTAFIPNVLKVFLENGQTKSFKYDSSTVIGDVLESLRQKLNLRSMENFSLCVEHIKSLKKNTLHILDLEEAVDKIARRPSAKNLRCVLRVTFMPRDICDLLRKDAIAFDYLFMQCCNDVVQDRFAPELKYDIALRLGALHIQQHALANNMCNNKLSMKLIDKECGLEKFLPTSLLTTMKRKELRKLLSHYAKMNASSMSPSGTKSLTAVQAKVQYLKYVSELPSYGAKMFQVTLLDMSTDVTLVVNHKLGVCTIRGKIFVPLFDVCSISNISVSDHEQDDRLRIVKITLQHTVINKDICLSLEELDCEELVLTLRGYYYLSLQKKLPMQKCVTEFDVAPPYEGLHIVEESVWNYQSIRMKAVDGVVPDLWSTLREPEKYRTVDLTVMDKIIRPLNKISLDKNMNQTCTVDVSSVMSMEVLENLDKKTNGYDDQTSSPGNRDSAITRVEQMQEMVDLAETYLNKGAKSICTPPTPSKLLALNSPRLDPRWKTTLPAQPPELELEGVSDSSSSSSANSTPQATSITSTPQFLRFNPVNGHVRRNGPQTASFGLHSPDNLTDEKDLQLLITRLQELRLPQFAEGTLYLDPDIIDLTMIPPPMQPPMNREILMPSSLPPPPNIYADAEMDTWLTLYKDCDGRITSNMEDIERFIASTCVPSPPPLSPTDKMVEVDFSDLDIQQTTPVVELTQEQILSFIIPPPPKDNGMYNGIVFGDDNYCYRTKRHEGNGAEVVEAVSELWLQDADQNGDLVNGMAKIAESPVEQLSNVLSSMEDILKPVRETGVPPVHLFFDSGLPEAEIYDLIRKVDILLLQTNGCEKSKVLLMQQADELSIGKQKLLTSVKHFVSMSKLFVKAATESNAEYVDNMLKESLRCLQEIVQLCDGILPYTDNGKSKTLLHHVRGVIESFFNTFKVAVKVQIEQNRLHGFDRNASISVLMGEAKTLASQLFSLLRLLRSL